MELQSPPIAHSNGSKWIYPLGYLLVVVSLTLFVIEDFIHIEKEGENLTIFFLHYFLAGLFVFALLWDRSIGVKKSWQKTNIHKTIISLMLFLISAYSLNRTLPVFEESVVWFCAYLILTSMIMLSYRFFESMPKWINIFQHTMLGAAMILYLYLSIYVSNFYIVGSIGIIAFGIGCHIFVPLFLLIGSITLLIHSTSEKKISLYFVALGFLIVIAIATTFIIEWNKRINAIDRMSNQSVLDSDRELPTWVKVGQSVKNDWITARILKSNLVYTVSNDHFQWDFFPSNANWDEPKKHDPLVFLASLFNKCSLSNETRIKILQSITESRHRAQERLWTGDNLTTSYIVSDIDIYPELRLAYTEKYLNIKNSTRRQRWWGAREEAIYTFQLPEGSVATSLSLWINGKEEKSILTSKQKANEAYKTIVGKEARDPSVLHWQEGNTVSVRIFPCTQNEERKFKIGITSPLPENHGRVVYSNIPFQGPNPANATETVRIRFIGKPVDLVIPSSFKRNKKGEYYLEHDYDPDLTISFSSIPLKINQFSFEGYKYSIIPYKPELVKIRFAKIYLDINNKWTQGEIATFRSLIHQRDVFVYVDNEFIKLNDENWNEAITDAETRNFSLFPFHRINDSSNSLVISKGKELSPHLADIKESIFAQKVEAYFSEHKKIKLFNLNGGVSTYVSSFRELRGLEFAEGDINDLKDILQNNQFPVTSESDEEIVLHDSHMIITKHRNDSTLKDNAPDHLARLFAYNDIMRKIGANYFKDDYLNDELVNEAATAYVVSPVSSLIVLETKADYNRFGITDKDNSLHNASKQSSGAVPEPHEWMLIILFVGIILFTTIRKYRLKIQS